MPSNIIMSAQVFDGPKGDSAMRMSLLFPLTGLGAFLLGACAPNYSPNTYSSNAVQLANKVEQGSIIGYREVAISANGSVGAVTGGAVGGVLGVEYAKSALATVGGTAVGGMLGNALEHAARDTTGWEYIIRKENGDMLSVTQRERDPLGLGQRVLVIMGPQARVVPDYSIPQEPRIAAAPPPEPEKKETKVEPVKVEVVLQLPPGVTVQPKPDETKIATVEEPPPVPLASLEEKIIKALTIATPLSSVLMETPRATAPSAQAPEIAATAETAPVPLGAEPISEAVADTADFVDPPAPPRE